MLFESTFLKLQQIKNAFSKLHIYIFLEGTYDSFFIKIFFKFLVLIFNCIYLPFFFNPKTI